MFSILFTVVGTGQVELAVYQYRNRDASTANRLVGPGREDTSSSLFNLCRAVNRREQQRCDRARGSEIDSTA